MLRCDLLIDQVREDTENESTGTEDALGDQKIIRRLNEAARRCASEIIKAHRAALTKFWSPSASGAEAYTVPSDIWARHRIRQVDYSPTGNARDYYKLAFRELSERRTVSGTPSAYSLANNTMYVNPYPATGSFRVAYDPLIAAMDKRRAKVASFTTGSGAITALTLTTAAPFTQADFDLADELTVVDAQGTIKMAGIPYTAVSAGGVVSILGGTYTYATGSAIAADDWVVLGKNASSHCELPDQCQDFVLTYASRRVLQGDRSSESLELKADELEMLRDIIDSFSDIPADEQDIPITDYTYFQDL
jgi:hypothetical protein